MGFWNPSLCFNVDSLSLSFSFPSHSNYRCSFAIQNLNQRAAYSFIYGHPCILAIQTHADTQIFTGLYGSADCICLLPQESKHHLLMNKLSDPLSFIHSVLALYMHAPDRQRFISVSFETENNTILQIHRINWISLCLLMFFQGTAWINTIRLALARWENKSINKLFSIWVL